MRGSLIRAMIDSGAMSRLLPSLTLLACFLAAESAVHGAAPPEDWKPLFDGKTLGSWKETPFPRRTSPVRVENGAIQLHAGQPLTGITWNGDFPASSGYEIRFEATRLRGGDFFASLTFPAVAPGGSSKAYATWVMGGWGGDIVGISSIDGWDASDNETRTYFEFETGRWYACRLRVTSDRIEAWIDEQRVVNVEIRGRELSLRRGDIGLSAPLGFASYNTAGAIRKIEYRPVAPRN